MYGYCVRDIAADEQAWAPAAVELRADPNSSHMAMAMAMPMTAPTMPAANVRGAALIHIYFLGTRKVLTSTPNPATTHTAPTVPSFSLRRSKFPLHSPTTHLPTDSVPPHCSWRTDVWCAPTLLIFAAVCTYSRYIRAATRLGNFPSACSIHSMPAPELHGS